VINQKLLIELKQFVMLFITEIPHQTATKWAKGRGERADNEEKFYDLTIFNLRFSSNQKPLDQRQVSS
jgi:hypothetical protein